MEAELSQLRQDLRQHRVPTSEEMVEGMEQNTGACGFQGRRLLGPKLKNPSFCQGMEIFKI